MAGTPSADALRRARWACRAQFGALGLVAGAWGAHVPSVKQTYGLSEGSLAWVLLAGGLGAVLSLMFAGRVVGALGVPRATLLAGASICACLAVVLLWPGLWLLVPMMLFFGATMSLMDVAINSEGTLLETLGGQAVMSNLHGCYSVGGMVGAALCGALLAAGVSAPLQLVGLALVSVPCVALACRAMLAHQPAAAGGQADGTGTNPATDAHFAWPRGLLLLIGLLIFVGMLAEGVMYDWCVLYLKQELGMPQATAALGYAAFAGAMAVARFGGDALRERVSERRLLRVGALLSAGAMAVVLLAGQPALALVGYALAGAGLAPVVPILFNAATRVPGVSRAAAIASVSSVGYAGFMVGPPLMGGLAHATSLTVAMGVVVASSLLLALGAGRVPAAGPQHGR